MEYFTKWTFVNYFFYLEILKANLLSHELKSFLPISIIFNLLHSFRSQWHPFCDFPYRLSWNSYQLWISLLHTEFFFLNFFSSIRISHWLHLLLYFILVNNFKIKKIINFFLKSIHVNTFVRFNIIFFAST